MSAFHTIHGTNHQSRVGSSSHPPTTHSDVRDARSPTMLREAATTPHSPTMFRTPDVVEQLLGGYRAQVLEHRENQDRLIRAHRAKEDNMFQNVLEIVRQMRGLPTPSFLNQEYLQEEDMERTMSEYNDVCEFQPTVEIDDLLGAQEMLVTRVGLDMRRRQLPTVDEVSPSRESNRQHRGSPSLNSGNDLSQGQRGPPILPTPAHTPNKRGGKRKRAIEIESPVEAGPSARPTLMGPPLRKAAQSALQKNREITEFLHRGPRAQSVAIANGSRIPYVVCHCQELSCEICGPKEKERRDAR